MRLSAVMQRFTDKWWLRPLKKVPCWPINIFQFLCISFYDFFFPSQESNGQVDGTPNEMTLTPLSSNESLPEQSFIPSFIKSNWVRSFQVPWNRMPAALALATSTGERARPGPRREFVRIVVAAMQAHCPNPNLAACGEVARNIVSTYPLTFGDISEEGEQLGKWLQCLQRQLKTRVEQCE